MGVRAMSARGQSRLPTKQSVTDAPFPPMWQVAIGIFPLFLLNLVAIAAFLATAAQAVAQGAPAKTVPVFVTPGEMRSGALLLKSENDRYVEAPLVATDVDLVVSGPTARARVTQ